MLRRFYAEKRQGYDCEAEALLREIRAVLRIAGAESLRVLTRYDVECERPLPIKETLSDPATAVGENAALAGARVFAAEPAEGESDEAALALCALLRLVCPEEEPTVRTAKLYALYGKISEEELRCIKAYVLSDGRRREASLSLLQPAAARNQPVPTETETLFGFRDLDMGGLDDVKRKLGLDMDVSELAFAQTYFKSEYRDPTALELSFLDAFFAQSPSALLAEISEADAADRAVREAYSACLSAREELGEEGGVTLRSLAELPLRLAQKRNALLGVSACGGGYAVKPRSRVGSSEGEAFFLSGEAPLFADPYAAMRLGVYPDTASLSPAERKGLFFRSEEEALRLALDGAAGEIAEVYHGGMSSAALSLGVYLSAPPKEEGTADFGDEVVVLGGKGPETEGRLMRLFRRNEAAELIKRARRIGAGGIVLSAWILAEGMELDLGAVPAEEGADALARVTSRAWEGAVAVVTAREGDRFIRLAKEEGLRAAKLAVVTEIPRLTIREKGKIVLSFSHEFLASGGRQRSIDVHIQEHAKRSAAMPYDLASGMRALASDRNICTERGLANRGNFFVGTNALLSSFGGEAPVAPARANVFSSGGKEVAYLAWGGEIGDCGKDAFRGGYLAVCVSVARLIAAGADLGSICLFSEQILEQGGEERLIGEAFSAVLGACKAQLDLGLFAVGGRQTIARGIPRTSLCFAAAAGAKKDAVSPAFKGAGHRVVLLAPSYGEDALPTPHSFIKNCKIVTALQRAGKVLSAYAVGRGGVAEGILKCCLGNEIGFRFADMVPMETVFGDLCGAFILELNDETAVGEELGRTTLSETVARGLDLVPLVALRELSFGAADPEELSTRGGRVENVTSFKKSTYLSKITGKAARVLLPVFADTQGAAEAARVFEAAGAKTELFRIDARACGERAALCKKFAEALGESDVLFLPDGREGDHVCGLGKFMAQFLRSDEVRRAVEDLHAVRGGLIGGIGAGFDALLRLGLLPFGAYRDEGIGDPMLAWGGRGVFTSIVNVRISSAATPWFADMGAGDVFCVPVRMGYRLVSSDAAMKRLAESGQIASQFVDGEGNASMDIRFDPGECSGAIEGLLSPDGRIYGGSSALLLRRRRLACP